MDVSEVSEQSDAQVAAPAASSGAGRGVITIAFAKFYFMFAGLIITTRLPGILSASAFGAYSLISSLVSPVNNVMVTGSIQAVSRFTAQKPEHARLVQHAGLRMHLYIGIPIAILFIAASPLVAWFLHDNSKIGPLMTAGVINGLYSIYAIFVGTANGQREFHKQAGLDITSATLRMVGILGTAALGLGVTGVIAGWVAASALILLISVVWVGLPARPKAAERLPVQPMIKFFIGVAVYLALFNVLMFVDIWLLKRFTAEHFASIATGGNAHLDTTVPWLTTTFAYHPTPAMLADIQVGYYNQVQNLARLSYQAIIAATFVIFPLMSKSTFEQDKATTRTYVEVTMRYSLMFAMAIGVVMAAKSADILNLIYGNPALGIAASALTALALGNVAFALFAVAGTMLNGAGLTGAAIVTALVTLILAVVGNWIAIPMASPGHQVLLVAATVTSGAMLFGAILSGIILHRRLGAFLPIKSVVRIALATGVAMGVGFVLPLHGKLLTLVAAAIVGVSFLATLVVTGELGKRDLAAISQVRKKRSTEAQP